MSTTEIERRVGRPRSVEADEAILEATVDLFTELGYDGVTVEGVAARAGVGKATVYRRYPAKLDLVMAACERICRHKGPTPDTGTLRDDLRELARGFCRMLTRTEVGKAIPATLAAKTRSDELARAHEGFIARRRADSSVIVERAVARGELPADVDVGLLLDLMSGPLFYRTFVSGEKVDDAYLDALADRVVRAFS